MVENDSADLTLEAAARLIYGTQRPTSQHIWQVRQKLRSRMLRAGTTGSNNSVSAYSVAQYMAQHELRRPVAGAQVKVPCHRDTGHRQLKSIYKDILTDYFLAVVLRRRAKLRSKGFEHTVTAGQVMLAGALLLGIINAMSGMITTVPPEHRVIDQWLSSQMGPHEVIQWGPQQPNPAGRGLMLRVTFRYNPTPGKGIETTRMFVLDQLQVVSADSPD